MEIDRLKPGINKFRSNRKYDKETRTWSGSCEELKETPSGDIERHEWVRLMEEAVKEDGLETLYESIKIYSRNNHFWLKNDFELREHSLECLASKAYEHWKDFQIIEQTSIFDFIN